jgi:hypothetical protein
MKMMNPTNNASENAVIRFKKALLIVMDDVCRVVKVRYQFVARRVFYTSGQELSIGLDFFWNIGLKRSG